jgi:hypothetical protein
LRGLSRCHINPPKGRLQRLTGDATIKAGQAVNFAGTASDPDGSVQKYSWFFPEGIPESSSVPSPGAIVFPKAGTYVVSLTVVDNKGGMIQVRQRGRLRCNRDDPTTLAIPEGEISPRQLPLSGVVAVGAFAWFACWFPAIVTVLSCRGQSRCGPKMFGKAS